MPDHVSIINPPRAAADVAGDDLVGAGDFWPAISIAEFRAVHRTSDEIPAPRVRAAIRSAIETAWIDLRAWASEQIELGDATLADVEAEEIDGTSRLVLCWQRAVMTLAKAEIVETHRDYDATGAGERDSDHLDDSITQLRRDAAFAIRDLKGRARTTVELI